MMDELKQALENMLFLIDEFVPFDCFDNGVVHNGIDEGQVITTRMINGARQVLSAHMSEQEKEICPIFQNQLSHGLPDKNNKPRFVISKNHKF